MIAFVGYEHCRSCGSNVMKATSQMNSNALFRKKRISLPLIVLSLSWLNTQTSAQQLRDAFRSVQQAVVIVRTEEKGLAPFPQQGLVSLSGLGSGFSFPTMGKC
jgi:hypothetical protein